MSDQATYSADAAQKASMLGQGLARQAAQAMMLRKQQMEAAEAAAMGGAPQAMAPAQVPPSGGMTQADFSGYGKQPAAPSQQAARQMQLIQLLRRQQQGQ